LLIHLLMMKTKYMEEWRNIKFKICMLKIKALVTVQILKIYIKKTAFQIMNQQQKCNKKITHLLTNQRKMIFLKCMKRMKVKKADHIQKIMEVTNMKGQLLNQQVIWILNHLEAQTKKLKICMLKMKSLVTVWLLKI